MRRFRPVNAIIGRVARTRQPGSRKILGAPREGDETPQRQHREEPIVESHTGTELVDIARETHETALQLAGELRKIKVTPGNKTQAAVRWAKRT